VTRFQFVLLPLLVLLLAGCSKPRDDARSRLRGVDVSALRLDAARIYKQLYASPGPAYIPLKPTMWPATFKTLKPQRVGVYPNGFALALDGSADSETGIHIVPQGLSVKPTSAHVRYELLSEGVYWYAHRPATPATAKH
jgi:hypothetical protein